MIFTYCISITTVVLSKLPGVLLHYFILSHLNSFSTNEIIIAGGIDTNSMLTLVEKYNVQTGNYMYTASNFSNYI
jgi:hypothetical protein